MALSVLPLITKLKCKDTTIYIIMMLFSLSSAMFFPVIQSFLFQQVCLENRDESRCRLNQASDDPDIHSQTNYIMMFGSVCMCGVAIYTSPKVGSFSDTSRRYAILIPLSGALAADLLFVAMAFVPFWLIPYLFALGELIYGLTGGYMAILSTIFSYLSCMKINREPHQRSLAMARMEGVIGLGAVLGNFLGAFGRVLPYSVAFIFFALVHMGCIALVFQLKNEADESNEVEMEVIEDVEDVPAPQEHPKNVETNWLTILLYVTFTLSFFSMIGSAHILFFYLKQQFFWDARGYSVFIGVIRFTSTLTALFLYPWLKNDANFSDAWLALLGLVSRILAKLWMAIAKSPAILYGAVIFESFGRFPATALRSMISVQTDIRKQGHAFGQIALLEAWCNLFAALFFHVVFPWSLSFLPELSFLLISIVLIPPTFLIWKYRHRFETNPTEAIDQC